MDTKKYYAADMGTALDQIKNELGSDAIIVKSRKVKEKSGLFGLLGKSVYEVTVCYDPDDVKKHQNEQAKKSNDPFKTILNEQKRRTEADSAALKKKLENDSIRSVEKRRLADRQRKLQPLQANMKIEPERFEKVERTVGEMNPVEEHEMLENLLHDDSYIPVGTTPTSKLGVYVNAMGVDKKKTEEVSPQRSDGRQSNAQQYNWTDAIQDAAMQSGEARAAILQARAEQQRLESEKDTAVQPATLKNTADGETAVMNADNDQEGKKKRGRPRKETSDNGNAVSGNGSINVKDNEANTANPMLSGDSSAWTDEMNTRMRSLEKLIETLPQKIQSQATTIAEMSKDEPYDEEMENLRNILIEQDIAAEAVDSIINDACKICASSGRSKREAIEEVLRLILGKPKLIRKSSKGPKIILLVGPTGVGKTTTLVKLVSSCLFERKSTVGIVNADVYRVGAQDQLAAYAKILDVPMITIHKLEEIKNAEEQFADKEFIFVDTCGKATMDKEYQKDTKRLIELGDIQDVFIVVSSTSSHRMFKVIADSYAFVPRYSVILTKLDETQTFGATVNMRYYDKHPLSYLTIGQNVPDDIMKADANEIIGKLLG